MKSTTVDRFVQSGPEVAREAIAPTAKDDGQVRSVQVGKALAQAVGIDTANVLEMALFVGEPGRLELRVTYDVSDSVADQIMRGFGQ